MTVPKPSRFLCVGPGGMKCRCCFPPRGTKDRRLAFRSAKRKAERDAARDAAREMGRDG